MSGERADYLVEVLLETVDQYYWSELYRGNDRTTVRRTMDEHRDEVVRVSVGRGSSL